MLPQCRNSSWDIFSTSILICQKHWPRKKQAQPVLSHAEVPPNASSAVGHGYSQLILHYSFSCWRWNVLRPITWWIIHFPKEQSVSLGILLSTKDQMLRGSTAFFTYTTFCDFFLYIMRTMTVANIYWFYSVLGFVLTSSTQRSWPLILKILWDRH